MLVVIVNKHDFFDNNETTINCIKDDDKLRKLIFSN